MGDLRAFGRVPLVLVIEDDQTQRQLLLRMLEAAAYEAIGVGDGENGLRAIVEHQPDLVLLDLNLPRIDGFEVCRRLRADPLTSTLPVIIITAHTSSQDMVAALDSGADDFITKPFQQVELLARMRSAFRLRRAITSLERAAQIVAALSNAVEAKDARPAASLSLAGAPRRTRRRACWPARGRARSRGLRSVAARRGQDRRARLSVAQGGAAVGRRVAAHAPSP